MPETDVSELLAQGVSLPALWLGAALWTAVSLGALRARRAWRLRRFRPLLLGVGALAGVLAVAALLASLVAWLTPFALVLLGLLTLLGVALTLDTLRQVYAGFWFEVDGHWRPGDRLGFDPGTGRRTGVLVGSDLLQVSVQDDAGALHRLPHAAFVAAQPALVHRHGQPWSSTLELVLDAPPAPPGPLAEALAWIALASPYVAPTPPRVAVEPLGANQVAVTLGFEVPEPELAERAWADVAERLLAAHPTARVRARRADPQAPIP